jgi:hypothetical protein
MHTQRPVSIRAPHCNHHQRQTMHPRNYFAACFIATGLMAGASHAQSPVDTLGRCLSDTTSGKDRKELARWIFVAMTTHPEIKALSSATPEDIDSASRAAGALFTRLMAEACANEMKAAIQAGGPAAIQAGFQTLGQLAMQELMTNAQVGAAMSVVDRYVDRSKIDAAIRSK